MTLNWLQPKRPVTVVYVDGDHEYGSEGFTYEEHIQISSAGELVYDGTVADLLLTLLRAQ